MQVKWTYSETQLNATVEFIAKHNENFLGEQALVRARLMDYAKEIASKFPDCPPITSMGAHVAADVISIESMDDEENQIIIDFWIDPSLPDRPKVSDFVELSISVIPK